MPTPLELLSTALADRYRIERELGAGGMATVYLARDLKHDRNVALKVLRPELAESLGRDRFLREIQLAATLSHPHILPLHDSGDASGALFYVMPNVDGQSLRDRLDDERQLPIDEAVRIAMEVAGALDHAHRHGVIHRDVKPENIMLQDGHALVADFGIGKAVDEAGADTLTQLGMSVGAPAYMSPEQAAGDEVDGRSDIYSLGCVLYEMIVGEQPFTGPTAQAVIARRFVQTPLDVASLREGVPRPVARAVQKALARVPIDRYDTAAMFVTSLGERAAVSTQPPAPEKSLAVLPFANLSSDPENEYFADGITEEILNALATIPDLRVAGRASSFSFKGKTQNLQAVGEALNVRTVLEGSVRRSGRRVRITVQLSDATDGFRMWSERYDREIEDVFALQDEIATAIAERLKTSLQVNAASQAQRTTDNIEAYEAYLKGRTILAGRGVSVTTEGLALLRRATELDHTYAPAWAGIADVYSVAGYYQLLPPALCATSAREAAAKALEFGPNLAETHTSLALIALLFDWAWETAGREFKRALELNPASAQARAWYGLFYLGLICGRMDESRAVLLKLVEDEPLSAYAAGVATFSFAWNGDGKDAVAMAEKALHLDATAPLSRQAAVLALYSDGQYEASIEMGEQVLAGNARNHTTLMLLAMTFARVGNVDAARAMGQELAARSVREYVSPLTRANIAAVIGDRDAALAFARTAFEIRDPSLPINGTSSMMSALQEMPEFRAMLASMGLPLWVGRENG